MIVALLLAAATAAPPTADPAIAEIVRLEQQWGEAFVRRDFVFLERIVAPEFRLVVTQLNGKPTIAARPEWMKNARQFRYERFSAETIDVNRVGDTAVASVRIANVSALRPGEKATLRGSLVTDTWVRRDGRWQVVHRYSHRLPVTPPPAAAAPASR